MTFLKLCDDDPIVNLLRDIFGANIIRVPDGRVRPLATVISTGERALFWGGLGALLEGEAEPAVEPAAYQLADVSGRRSRRVTLSLGLFLLRGFLYGLGIPTAGIDAMFAGASALSFALPAVRRHTVDIPTLGRALAGHRLDRANPAAAIFFAPDAPDLLVIDSVLASSQVVVTLTGSDTRRLAVDVEGLQQIVAGSGASVAASEGPEVRLAFTSAREVPFAFSCVRVFYDAEGLITALPPDMHTRTLGDATTLVARRALPERVLLGGQPGLLMWDG